MITKIITFNELSNTALYDCLALRFNVFVVEQDCIYPELDNIDKDAFHLLAYENDQLAGYLRIYIDENNYVKIGRIVINKYFRGKDYGKVIINEALNFIPKTYSNKTIKINAQQHLKEFYESFGFKKTSDAYLDYGILHIDMELILN